MQTIFLLAALVRSSFANHCSAPVWEGGSLLSADESCQRKNLKGAWCQQNPSNCATCSGIWCDVQTEDDLVSDNQKDAESNTAKDVDVSPIEDDIQDDHGHNDQSVENLEHEDVDSDSHDVCTGRPELDALLRKSKIAKVSKIADSDVYTWSGFCRAVRMMDAIGLPLELGSPNDDDELAIGAANIASLLAQTMWESGGEAPFSACDENNYTGKLDAACTQRYDGQRYDSLVSSTSCQVDPQMSMTAETHASWTPGPMQCVPGTITEGCCWWGRGAIQTTGPHNYAMLQRNVVGKLSQFDNVDLCTNPEAICQVDELKWLGALYYWTSIVQRETNFPCSLQSYVRSGFDLSKSIVGGADFATGCGGSVNNGHWSSTPHGNVGRLGYFNNLMEAMRTNGLHSSASGSQGNFECGKTKHREEAQPTDVCMQCSGAENCYVHGWAVPCMETTRAFCSNTHNSVWCGATSNADTTGDIQQDEGSDVGDRSEKESIVDATADGGEITSDSDHAKEVDTKQASGTSCTELKADADTGHCQYFLAKVANILDIPIHEITSFTSDTPNVPLCTKGPDGTFATSQGGLWTGVLYKVCTDPSNKPSIRRKRNLRGRLSKGHAAA